eukprot:TRINITY_DN1609_c0_g1_i2.p1 TRINITY_DN1609_c0_g1~~TRINITY_DN1609_c0_g1_i2.p1  ORF type:complete len:602 (+),score=84.00 TRINITY_DN1609_c0_g1_i2:143-1807(+)
MDNQQEFHTTKDQAIANWGWGDCNPASNCPDEWFNSVCLTANTVSLMLVMSNFTGKIAIPADSVVSHVEMSVELQFLSNSNVTQFFETFLIGNANDWTQKYTSITASDSIPMADYRWFNSTFPHSGSDDGWGPAIFNSELFGVGIYISLSTIQRYTLLRNIHTRITYQPPLTTQPLTTKFLTTKADPTTGTEQPAGGDSSTNEKNNNLKVIIGLSVGAVVLLGASAIFAFFIVRRIMKRDSPEESELPMAGPVSPNVNYLEGVEVLNRLGGGHFGEVFLGKYHAAKVALKKLKDENSWKEFSREAAIIASLNHPNIVRYLGVYSSPKEGWYIVMEYLSEGSLDVLVRRKDLNLQISDLIAMAVQASAGMVHLEAKKVLHRDIALRNFLVDRAGSDYVIKVGDFGMSRSTQSDQYSSSKEVELPIKWTAPESLLYGNFTSKSDVWSFGVALWELFSYGALPYPGLTNREVVDDIQAGRRLTRPPKCPEEIYKLMLKCWKEDPEKRPTFIQIYQALAASTPDIYATGSVFRPRRENYVSEDVYQFDSSRYQHTVDD